jgi:molybdopterin biosynthesis enzyme
VGWTQLFYGRLSSQGAEHCVRPITGMSRLAAMAEADCLIELPEDQENASPEVTVQKIWKIR